MMGLNLQKKNIKVGAKEKMITVRIDHKRGYDKAKELDKGIRKLKKIVDKEGTLKALQENRYFEKPGDKKRKKSARARSRARKDAKMRDKGLM